MTLRQDHVNFDSSAVSIRRPIMVGTRGSALAQLQTQYIIGRLKSLVPDLIALSIIKTAGDKDQVRPLSEFGGLGVFTMEIENALLAREIDIAVHSLKDLPTETTPGLVIAAVPEREDSRDCIVSRHGVGVTQLPQGARVGTSSARRSAQVLALRPDLQITPLRGNVDTRLRKAQTTECDAVVLAAAGIIRLGRASEITEYLSLQDILPDPGQGALAVEVREDDHALVSLLENINHSATHAAVTAERAFLLALGGGCRMPIGAFAELHNDRLNLRGMVASLDGKRIIRGEINGDPGRAAELGSELAELLLNQGAAEILGLPFESAERASRARSALPLLGKRIVVTRAQEQAGVLADKIRALGGEPVEFPTIQLAPVEDFGNLDRALRGIGEFDWLVFTSVNGVNAAAKRLEDLGLKPEIFGPAKIAAIGPATAQAVERLGVHVDFVPTRFLGEQIARELPVNSGQRALLLRADIASNVLAVGLAQRGVIVTNVEAYRTVMPAAAVVDLNGVDAITFSSSSTVRNFVAMQGAVKDLKGVQVFCIGPVTAETARELGLHVSGIAAEHTVDGLLNTIVEHYKTRN